MKKRPENFTCAGAIMTNFDGSIKPGSEDLLKNNDVFGDYPGWNFHATVWFDRKTGLFMSCVKQYRVIVEIITSESLQGIMDSVSKKYGYD